MLRSMRAARLCSEWAMPLGRPVVPEVMRMSAGASGASGAGGCSRDRVDGGSAVRNSPSQKLAPLVASTLACSGPASPGLTATAARPTRQAANRAMRKSTGSASPTTMRAPAGRPSAARSAARRAMAAAMAGASSSTPRRVETMRLVVGSSARRDWGETDMTPFQLRARDFSRPVANSFPPGNRVLTLSLSARA